MLDYEWGNPSTIMLTGDEAAAAAAAAAADSEQTHRQIFDHYNSHPFLPDHLISQAPPGPTPTTTTSDFSLVHHHHQQFHSQPHHHIHHHHHQHSLFDTHAFPVASSSHFPPPPPPAQPPHSIFSLDPLPPANAGDCGPGGGLLLVPKSEDVVRSMDFSASRIGLNLGGRTYFSSEDDFVSRLYRRPRPLEPGSTMTSLNNNSPRCQAEGCNADLSHAKHYHRRHKVCEFHSKAATVIAAGLTQRFCQQCSRFHLLSEFDNGKRSCRKRLADHNRRRRKTQQPLHQETAQKSPLQKPRNSALNIVAKGSPPDSGIQSSSSVTVAVSPPDYFQQKSYENTTTSRTLFFSSG